jgi:glycosyltransferase involved in cell wall biosynthesis
MRTIRRGAGLAMRLVRDAGRIVTERPIDGGGRWPAAIARDLRDYALSAWAARSGSLAAAASRADGLLARHPDLWAPLLIRSAWSSRQGEPSAALAATRRLRSMSDTALLRRRERDLTARLLETDPTWLPEIDGEPTPIEPRATNVVMHLLKASLPDRQSGYTIRSRETLRAQVAAGLEPFVVTPYGYPPTTARPDVPSEETIDGIVHHRLGPGAPLRDLSDTDELSRTATLAADVALRERPAIIHAASGHRGAEYALVAAALKRHLEVPIVYEVRGFLEASWTGDEAMVLSAEAAELTRRRLATEDRMMAIADGVTTLGTAMRDELVARGVPEEKVVVVPNGIDPDEFRPRPPDPELRRRYGLEDRWVFGYISNMDHFREGHTLLIEAAGRLAASGRQVACLLVGDGTLRRELEGQARAAGLASSVIFAGQVPHGDVQAHYALLDAFVVARQPDRASRFVTPLKPYEAMAMGVPVVVSDLPALTEIATPGQRGLAFPVGDASGLAAALGRLMDEPDLGRTLAAAARDWVVTERTWAANGIRYRDLYRSILEGGLSPERTSTA